MDTMYFEPLDPTPVDVAEDLQMPQFSLVKNKVIDCSMNYTTGFITCWILLVAKSVFTFHILTTAGLEQIKLISNILDRQYLVYLLIWGFWLQLFLRQTAPRPPGGRMLQASSYMSSTARLNEIFSFECSSYVL